MVKKQRDLVTHLLGPESAASGGKGSVHPPLTWEVYLLLPGVQRRFKVSS